MSRRQFLKTAGGILVAAPAIVHAANIMPVRTVLVETDNFVSMRRPWHGAWITESSPINNNNQLFVERAGHMNIHHLPDGSSSSYHQYHQPARIK